MDLHSICKADATLSGQTRRRVVERDDSGQALVIIVVLLVLLVMLAPMMARQVTSDVPLVATSTEAHAALAAAEAGIQWYRDNLDSYANFYNYTSGNNPTNDAALATGGGVARASLRPVTCQGPIHLKPSTTAPTPRTCSARPATKPGMSFSP